MLKDCRLKDGRKMSPIHITLKVDHVNVPEDDPTISEHYIFQIQLKEMMFVVKLCKCYD